MQVAFSQEKVAIFDSGINNPERFNICKGGLINATTDKTMSDSTGHGTNMASIINKAKNKNFCLVIIKVFDKKARFHWDRYLTELLNIQTRGVTHINMSFEGKYIQDLSDVELGIINYLLESDIKINIAAGNGGLNLDRKCSVYPACLGRSDPRIHTIGANDLNFSNRGNFLYLEKGRYIGSPPRSGTSQATAIHTRKRLEGLYD